MGHFVGTRISLGAWAWQGSSSFEGERKRPESRCAIFRLRLRSRCLQRPNVDLLGGFGKIDPRAWMQSALNLVAPGGGSSRRCIRSG